MPPTAAELLAALPAEDHESNASYEQEIEAIMRALADRPVPTGAWRRLWSLGGLSTKLGLAYFAYWIRTSFRPGTEADVLAACQRSLQFTDDEMRKHSELVQLVAEGFHHYNEWILFDGDFDFGDPGYLQRGADWLGRVSQYRCVQQNPVNVFSHRLNFQLPALLFRLKCRVNAYQLGADEYGQGSRLRNYS